MINTFYQALQNAQNWFFGDLLADPFFAGCVQIFNSVLLFSLFFGLFIVPCFWALQLLVKHVKGRGVDIDDE